VGDAGRSVGDVRATVDGAGGEREAYRQAGIQELLAQIADLRAVALYARALACEERARAEAATDDAGRVAAQERAAVAELRADAQDQQADSLSRQLGVAI